MDLTPRGDHNGFGRELQPSDQKKVPQQEITQSFPIDTVTIRQQKAVFANGDAAKMTNAPGPNGWDVREGEMAFRLRFSPNGGVMTAINGLESAAAKMFPDNPVLVRDIVSSMIVACGIVREDANTDQNGPLVTLRVGGTAPFGAPKSYNVIGMEQAFIEGEGGVVFDVPNLKEPIQFGTEASGRPKDKITLVARAASKVMIATRALNIISHLIHDPARFREALDNQEHLGNAWVNLGFAVLNSYKTAHSMAQNQDLRHQDRNRGAPFLANPLFNELGDRTTSPEEVVARYAELTGLLPAGRVKASLSPAQRQFWAEHEFALKNVLIPTPHIDSKSYNAAYAFGYVKNGPAGTIESLATNGDTVKRTPIGELYAKSLVHGKEMIENLSLAVYDEARLNMGVAHSTPNPNGTGLFMFQIIPNGGVGVLK